VFLAGTVAAAARGLDQDGEAGGGMDGGPGGIQPRPLLTWWRRLWWTGVRLFFWEYHTTKLYRTSAILFTIFHSYVLF